MIAKHTAHREAAEAFVKEFLKTDFVAKGGGLWGSRLRAARGR